MSYFATGLVCIEKKSKMYSKCALETMKILKM